MSTRDSFSALFLRGMATLDLLSLQWYLSIRQFPLTARQALYAFSVHHVPSEGLSTAPRRRANHSTGKVIS